MGPRTRIMPGALLLDGAVIRTRSTIYSDVEIGERERTRIGKSVRVGPA